MAYADKITTMRRFAAIEGSAGIIFAEGVDIEGTLVYKLVADDTVASMDRDQFSEFLSDKNALIVYQDAEGEDFWEPRSLHSQVPYIVSERH